MSRPTIVFAHGAGAPSSSEWMRGWANRLAATGDVRPFDYPYMAGPTRRGPDPMPVLMKAHRAAIESARAENPQAPVVLAGKSMGSRVGCHVAAEDPSSCEVLVCFGYPLRGMNGASRADVLLRLSTPILFLQGTRDKLCPEDELADVRARMKAPSALFIVDGGDHDLTVGVRTLAKQGRSQADWDRDVGDAIATFLRERGLAP